MKVKKTYWTPLSSHFIIFFFVLGLFQPSHMQYDALRHLDPLGEPSLAEMVDKSIDILSKNKEHGYFLHVEGNLIHRHTHTVRVLRVISGSLIL